MYRVEQLREVDGVLHVVGEYTTIDGNGFKLVDVDTSPKFVNTYALRFPRAGDPYVVTHIGFFPLTEYTGIVMKLVDDLPVGREGEVGFKAESIVITVENKDMIRTAVKGAS